MSGKITEAEKHILETMYDGDKDRDASAKIRGFLFQDLAAIEFLLEDDVQYVCIEFLEDIDVIYKDGTLKIIQVKYYPQTNLDKKEIMTDLYYQYLRLVLLKGKWNIKPQLLIHREKNISVTDETKMKEYVGAFSSEKYALIEDIETQLKKQIHPLNKKQQKAESFKRWANEKTITEFLKAFEIIKKGDIQSFQSEIENKMEKKFSGTALFSNQKDRKKILMGLAVLFVQQRYALNTLKFDEIRISKDEFETHIQKCLTQYADEHIVAYISAIAAERYEEIIFENENMTEKQVQMLSEIYRNTIQWIANSCDTVEGQFRVVNTLSNETKEKLEDFCSLGTLERLLEISGCKESIRNFFDYLWKIIFDICSKEKNFDIQKNKKLLHPEYYMDMENMRYICLRFPGDYAETSVILPPEAGDFKVKKKKICKRITEEKPRKWLMKYGKAGKYEYNYNVANMQENDVVTNMNDDWFVVECMQCVKKDGGEWTEIDDCEKCIFAEGCIKGMYE